MSREQWAKILWYAAIFLFAQVFAIGLVNLFFLIRYL